MARDTSASSSRRDSVRMAALIVVVIAACLWASLQLLEPVPPRRIVLASGVETSLFHHYAGRYKEMLARDGITVEERMTAGAAENLRLLQEPGSGVDIAFMQGGVAHQSVDNVVMLASLYYEPLWLLYRKGETATAINQLLGKRIATGTQGSGTKEFVGPLLAANGITADNSRLLPLGGTEALHALKSGQVDVVMYTGGARTQWMLDALRDPALELMSLARADAYARRFAYITRLTLPPGTIDFARDIPKQEVLMIGTKAMLAARDGLHPALVRVLTDAAREIHGEQGQFEAAGEFPATARVDLRVSSGADQHRRFGSGFLYRRLPFWVATFVERALILVVPLIAVLVPLINYLPLFLRWRARSRIYRWYGQLTLLERDVNTREGPLPVKQWLQDLDRVERAVLQIRLPPSYASEAYTLREHVAMVRRLVLDKAGAGPNVALP